VQVAARERDITLTVNLPDAALPIQGDPQRLAQVLLNLLTNALHYTPTGGAITVGATRHDHEVWLRVADTGAGIPTANLPYVFERFYRTDTSRASDKGGSGLGLAIVRSLVAVHGGRVWVESREGQGSTFTVALPLAAS
jgi:signal transduction histidine kinase